MGLSVPFQESDETWSDGPISLSDRVTATSMSYGGVKMTIWQGPIVLVLRKQPSESCSEQGHLSHTYAVLIVLSTQGATSPV